MQIKTNPRDFVVEESLACPVLNKGAYKLFKLAKQDLNTLDALRRVAHENRLPLESLGYGGRKDKHAFSTQYITVKDHQLTRLKLPGIFLEHAGWLDRPMGPDLIAANRFRIVIRDLSEQEKDQASPQLKTAARGIVNYFGDQRFGPFDRQQGFLAEKIIKKHFNGALKFYLTHPGSQDKKGELDRKQKLFTFWGRWEECRRLAVSNFERMAFDRLRSSRSDFAGILRNVPGEEMAFHFASYQSFLWNEVLRRIISKKGEYCRFSPGFCGDYIFPQRPEVLPAFLPTAASRMEFSDAESKNEYDRLFEEREIKSSLFNLKKTRQAHFKSIARPVLMIPENLTFSFSKDELYEKKEKLCLDFSLMRGSYATMLIKYLFAESKSS